MTSRLLSAFVVAVLGVSCTEDRPAPRAAPSPTSPAAAPSTCPRPGPAPEGFVLTRSRNQGGPAIREVYWHPDGRLLVFLLGVEGEIG